MLRIRQLYSAADVRDAERIEQVKDIFRRNFGAVAEYAEKIPEMLDDPFKYGFRAALLISETSLGKVSGFSLILHFPEINASWLDFIAVADAKKGGGLGGALYEASREYCVGAKSRGLYMELLPDDPGIVANREELEQNKRRLKFYEHYGVRPIVGTLYETPVGKGSPPYLAFDGLGRPEPLRAREARQAVRTILKRKYSHLVDEAYIEKVARSFTEDPVRIREARYVLKEAAMPVASRRLERAFAVVSSEAHMIHHVRERGYVERPARVGALKEAILETGLFDALEVRHFGSEHITAVHERDFIDYLRNVCLKLESKRPVYPYVFPIRRPERRPKDLAVRAGYYCIDTFTPLDKNAYSAARSAVDVAMTAADELMRGRRVAYALCRPPGHHAERRVFGGFCYMNNAAIAANYLSKRGRVAILDIDFHHCNGTQDIFYRRSDVLVASIHGHPNFAYPYFSGFTDEVGEGEGKGFNLNLPLHDGAGEAEFLAAFEKVERAVAKFRPDWVVVSLGLDIMRGDPTGAFALSAATIAGLGGRIARMGKPTLVVQEGGYSIANLRRGGKAFFVGMAEAMGGNGNSHALVVRNKTQTQITKP